MSVFSIMKKGRQAKEQSSTLSGKQSGKQKEEPTRTKYRHVPTHAGSDALLGAPAGWVRDDAARIRESNHKRISAMASPLSGRFRQSVSSNMLSPMHIDVHASSASSSRGSTSAGYESQSRNSQFGRAYSSPNISNMHMSHSFNSLDAELYRSQAAAALDGHAAHALRRAPAASVPSLPPSQLSTSPSSTPFSSQSTTPSTSSAPSIGAAKESKTKDGERGSSGELYEEYGLPDAEGFEMRVLRPDFPTSLGSARTHGSHINVRIKPSQRNTLPAALEHQQHSLDERPAGAADPLASLQMPPRPTYSRSSSGRSLGPTMIPYTRAGSGKTGRDMASTGPVAAPAVAVASGPDVPHQAAETVDSRAVGKVRSSRIGWPLYARGRRSVVAA